jgi:hypothetical protein
MQYAAHEAEMNTIDKDGVRVRDHYTELARRGRQDAIEKLEGYPLPDSVSYLYDWATHMVGRSGVGMSGLAPLSYGTVRDWATLTGNDPKPHEVEALMALDSVMRGGVKKEAAKSEPEPQPVEVLAWPSKKKVEDA